MDRDTAVSLAQQAIKANNRRLVEQVLKIQADRGEQSSAELPLESRPLIAVTCSTGWECYAVVDELVKTRKFRVRALYRTPGTQAAERLERLLARTESEQPGLLSIHSGVDMNSAEKLIEAFHGCDGVVLYLTANEAKAGKITNHGNDAAGGRARLVMRQLLTTSLAALRANPERKTCRHARLPDGQGAPASPTDAPAPPVVDTTRDCACPIFCASQGVNVCTASIDRPTTTACIAWTTRPTRCNSFGVTPSMSKQYDLGEQHSGYQRSGLTWSTGSTYARRRQMVPARFSNIPDVFRQPAFFRSLRAR